MRDVWARVLQLGIESIHHQDSFIALGGSSLQAITTVTELRKIGIAIELATLVGSSSIAEIATSGVSIATDMLEDPKPFAMIKELTERHRYETKDGATDAYPVTPLQESLLAASLGGSPAYTYQRVWDMQGVDVAKLRNAMQVVFESSDILRTSFVPYGKSYLQIVRNDMKLPWKTSSVRLVDYKNSIKEVDITTGLPLFNFTLVQGRYLVESIHHSLFDFWSHRFIYEDITAVYFGQSLMKRPPFKRFVSHILNADHNSLDSFWEKYLENASRTVLNHSPSYKQVKVEKTLGHDFKRNARTLGLTTGKRICPNSIKPTSAKLYIANRRVGSILYAAWAIVLSRHVGSEDISFATTLSGRETPITAIDRLDGPTLTTVPQRISVNPNITALAFAKSVNSGMFQLMKFAQHGMRRALSAAKQPSDYFDTLVNILVKDQDDGLSPKLFKSHGPRPTWSSEYTTLELEELDTGFQLRLVTNMEHRRAGFLLDSVALTVNAILEKPATEVRLLDILGAQERAFLMAKDSVEDIPESLSLLHSRFETIAATDPDKVAIDWDSQRDVTYQELDRYAGRIAAYLNLQDVGRGDIVPLFLDKSIEMVAAILGTMKAGAAYVPLSPDNPIDRNSYIIRDVGGEVILTHSHYQDVWQGYMPVANVSDIISAKDGESKPSVDQSPDDIAYVIYTSGSTGNPKGVEVPHHAASAAVASMLEAEGRMDSEWRTLQFANYVFDASVQDIFNTLSSGK